MATLAKERGYTKQLLVLPFDHRNSFQEKMFGIHGTPTAPQTAEIADFKMLIFEGFEKAVRSGLPKEMMGILVDEQFGHDVLLRAKAHGFNVSIAAEKSGQDEFDFQYPNYAEHIEKYSPDFVKVLVRYNPEGDADLNRRQAHKLVELSHYLDRSGRKFMFELLVPATDAQLKKCNGDKVTYDLELRPGLMVQAIQQLQKAGVEPDVWKLEGLDRKADFEKVCAAARVGGRDKVACIVLGRGESDEKVRQWLTVGANVPGVIGFAVGRTVWWDALKAYKEKRATREQAAEQMAKKYGDFCRLWLEERS